MSRVRIEGEDRARCVPSGPSAGTSRVQRQLFFPPSDNYETAAKKELGRDYPDVSGDARKVPMALWYANNVDDIPEFEKQMRRKVHYVIQPPHLWNSIASMARTQNAELLNTLQAGFKYIVEQHRDGIL